MASVITVAVSGFLASLLPIHFAAGQCTFPTGVQGLWTTGKRGNLTISTDHIFNFPIDDVGTFNFKCIQTYEGRYILETTTPFSYIDPSLIFSALICLDFREISDYLYLYYMGSKLSSEGRIYFSLNAAPWNATDICYNDPDDIPPQAYEVMIKDGMGSQVKRSCPSSLRAYWAYEFDKGSGNECPNQGSLDTCQSQQVLFNYTQCDTRIAYSDSGNLSCIFSVTNGQETFVTLWNDDPSVDESNTYRIICLAYQKSSGDLLMTQHPQICGDYQNSTYVDMSVGAELRLFDKNPTTPTDWTWLYITIGVLLGFFFIVALIAVLLWFKKYKAKQKPYRGGLEPANMAANGTNFKLAQGIPESDAPINVMHLLKKDLLTPGGRDTPSSTFDVTVKTPPQIFNAREIDSYSPNPSKETTSIRKDYHVLGGADQSEYGDLPMDDERSTKTPVMVLPLKTPGVALEEEDDDYDDDDDDELIMPTPGRSSLVSAKTGTMWEDPMCPATRLPGIVEDYSHPGEYSSRVGCRKPIPNGVITKINFLNEDGDPLPPRTPTPPNAVETIRDEHSKLRVKVKRKASLTKTPLPKIEEKKGARGMLSDNHVDEPDRGERNPERGDESNTMELVFTVPVLQPKLATGIGPASNKANNSTKGGKQPGAMLKSRTTHLENKRGEGEKNRKEFSPRRDKHHDGETKQSPRHHPHPHPHPNPHKKDIGGRGGGGEKKQPSTPRKNNKVDAMEKKEMKIIIEDGSDLKDGKKPRPKSVAGTKDSVGVLPEVDEAPRPSSGLRMTRIDIPDLSPPSTANSLSATNNNNEIIDSPPQSGAKRKDSTRSGSESASRKLWLDPVRPSGDVWGQMSTAWRHGQSWPDK